MYSVNLINCNNGFILLKSVTKIKRVQFCAIINYVSNLLHIYTSQLTKNSVGF